MTIKVVRNEAGNCVNFVGSSNPVYWNGCLTAEVDSVQTDTINIINTVRSRLDDGQIAYEFYRIPYTFFVNADNEVLESAEATAAYITSESNFDALPADYQLLAGLASGYLFVVEVFAG